jgi:hypothetical protein
MDRQRSKKGDVRLKHLFPRCRERLFHNPQSPYASPSNQPIDEWRESQSEKSRMVKPARNPGRHCRRASKGEGLIAVSPVPVEGHQHLSSAPDENGCFDFHEVIRWTQRLLQPWIVVQIYLPDR